MLNCVKRYIYLDYIYRRFRILFYFWLDIAWPEAPLSTHEGHNWGAEERRQESPPDSQVPHSLLLHVNTDQSQQPPTNHSSTIQQHTAPWPRASSQYRRSYLEIPSAYNNLRMAQCEYDIWFLFPVKYCVLIRRQQQQLYICCMKLVMIG